MNFLKLNSNRSRKVAGLRETRRLRDKIGKIRQQRYQDKSI